MPRKKRETPQQKWARRQKRRGNCVRCGEPRHLHRQLCDPCQEAFTKYMRAYRAKRRQLASAL